ncbi:MAG: hypothetical protein EXS32_13720 [Opitutus sp.]|nr:hypothetical protein [Opitutus sp.]
MALAREATAAAEAKDFPAYLAKMEQAVALRPDFPRMLVNLAAAQAANDRPEDASATLGQLAALGLHSAVEKSEEFAVLRDRKDFKDAVKLLAANLQPKGAGEMAFTLPEMTGVVEGIAWREKTGAFYFGEVHHRAVWLRTPDKKVRRFSAEDEAVLGVFGLAVDEEHGALWAATSAVPAMQGYTDAQDGAAGVAEFELETGALRRVVRVPPTGDHQTHVLGDLALAPDGSVYLPDSGAGVLWRLAPGASELEVFLASPEFMSLQGVVVAPDGGALYLSDHANGLLRVELRSRQVSRLAAPPATSLIGLDGLGRAPNGDLIGVQNGTKPTRVLRIALDATGEAVTAVTVLESAHLTMAAPALGCIATDGNFFFIGQAGWSRFDLPGAGPTPPRPVPIFKTKLEPEAAKRK